MHFFSTKRVAKEVNFKEAIFKGLPEDNGLYMPERIEVLSKSFFDALPNLTLPEIAFEMSRNIIDGEITDADLISIVNDAFDFPAPAIHVHDQVHVLELFHGPTLAFKDFGARFMARVMGHFLKNEDQEITILVATSGDTGSAVAQGFYGVEGVNVVLLYPKGKVSKIQEQQLTTIGGNVTALEVDGVFDDCQSMVKQAFLDGSLKKSINLSSANSINIARLLPQSFYYAYAHGQIAEPGEEIYFCTPSGNFGNLAAGIIAKKMGLPVRKFIAATNVNDVVPEYLQTALFNPRPSIATISNAMDVGNPSNFPRIQELFGKDFEYIVANIEGVHYTDGETRLIIKQVFDEYHYVMCPHTAIGYQGLVDTMEKYKFQGKGVYLSTASPAKFGNVVEPVIHRKVEIPERLQKIINRPKHAIEMSTDYEAFREYLLSR